MVDSLDQLPYLCLDAIFERLDYKSVLNCRLVCKLFKNFADATKFSELIVSDEIERSRDVWYHTGGLIYLSTAIGTNLFVASLTSSPFKLDETVKCLYLNIKHSREFFLVLLGQMQNLEQLHLLIDSPKTVKKQLPVISLPKLRILHFSWSGEYASGVNRPVLVAPSLTHLKDSSPDSLRFIAIHDPTTVKHLELYRYSYAVESFTNVEHLQINHLLLDNVSHGFDKEILTILKSLKVLNVNFRRPRELIYKLAREELVYIKGRMLELERTVAINVNGVPFDEDVFQTGVDHIGYMESVYQMDTALAAQLKNYDQLATDLSFMTEIDFNHLMWMKAAPLPNDFFRRYHNIRVVKTAKEVDHKEEFVRFLGNLRLLEELNLNCSCLSQLSLDQLPSVCSRIVRFEFWDYGRRPINFNFVLQFPLLTRFATNETFSIYWVVKAMKSLPNMKTFHFKSRASEIQVKILPNAYTFECRFGSYDEGDAARSFTKDPAGLEEMIAFSKGTRDSSRINKFRNQLGH